MKTRAGSVLLIAGFWLVIAPFASLRAQDFCGEKSRDLPVEKALASGSVWAHLFGRDVSAKSQATHVISAAVQGLLKVGIPREFCPPGCVVVPPPDIIFYSSPKQVLPTYGDKEHCLKMQQETQSQPLMFKAKSFDTVDELISWFSDFSRGKGDDGEELYEKCDGNCTPRYMVRITPDQGAYIGQALVVCGEARDKDDNQFILGTFYRFTCKRDGGDPSPTNQ